MLGMDFRDEDDIINDVRILNDICQDYKEVKSKLSALMLGANIEEMIKCDCKDFHNDLSIADRMSCNKCGGLGYILKYKEKRE